MTPYLNFLEWCQPNTAVITTWKACVDFYQASAAAALASSATHGSHMEKTPASILAKIHPDISASKNLSVFDLYERHLRPDGPETVYHEISDGLQNLYARKIHKLLKKIEASLRRHGRESHRGSSDGKVSPVVMHDEDEDDGDDVNMHVEIDFYEPLRKELVLILIRYL